MQRGTELTRIYRDGIGKNRSYRIFFGCQYQQSFNFCPCESTNKRKGETHHVLKYRTWILIGFSVVGSLSSSVFIVLCCFGNFSVCFWSISGARGPFVVAVFSIWFSLCSLLLHRTIPSTQFGYLMFNYVLFAIEFMLLYLFYISISMHRSVRGYQQKSTVFF